SYHDYLPYLLQTLSLHDALPICAAWRQILSEEDTSSIDSFVEAQSSTKVKQVTLLDQIGKKITFECKLELIFDDVTNQTYLVGRLEEHTSELQSRFDLVCRLLLE